MAKDKHQLLVRHGMTNHQFAEAVSLLQRFILFEDAFLPHKEKITKIIDIINQYPHTDMKSLITKVSILDCLILWLSPTYSNNLMLF